MVDVSCRSWRTDSGGVASWCPFSSVGCIDDALRLREVGVRTGAVPDVSQRSTECPNFGVCPDSLSKQTLVKTEGKCRGAAWMK